MNKETIDQIKRISELNQIIKKLKKELSDAEKELSDLCRQMIKEGSEDDTGKS